MQTGEKEPVQLSEGACGGDLRHGGRRSGRKRRLPFGASMPAPSRKLLVAEFQLIGT